MNGPDHPPASMGEEISESKVIWQDRVILFTVLAGGRLTRSCYPLYVQLVATKARLDARTEFEILEPSPKGGVKLVVPRAGQCSWVDTCRSRNKASHADLWGSMGQPSGFAWRLEGQRQLVLI